jgi:hypothetical protein
MSSWTLGTAEEAGEGRPAHNNEWNGVDEMVSNPLENQVLDVCNMVTFIPFQTLLWARPPQLKCHRRAGNWTYTNLYVHDFKASLSV